VTPKIDFVSSRVGNLDSGLMLSGVQHRLDPQACLGSRRPQSSRSHALWENRCKEFSQGRPGERNPREKGQRGKHPIDYPLLDNTFTRIADWAEAQRAHLPVKTRGHVSCVLKRLRLRGPAKKVGRAYRDDLPHFGKEIIAAALKLKALVLIPQFAFSPAS